MITQDEFNKIGDLRPYLRQHPDQKMVTASCLHSLGDNHQRLNQVYDIMEQLPNQKDLVLVETYDGLVLPAIYYKSLGGFYHFSLFYHKHELNTYSEPKTSEDCEIKNVVKWCLMPESLIKQSKINKEETINKLTKLWVELSEKRVLISLRKDNNLKGSVALINDSFCSKLMMDYSDIMDRISEIIDSINIE